MKLTINNIIVCFLLISSSPAAAKEINISDNDIYVKKGFSLQWLQNIPVNDKSWLLIPNSGKDKSLRIVDLQIQGLPIRSFFSYDHFKPATFTFITGFKIKNLDTAEKFLGLYIDQIAENWEIYLNGTLVKSELHVNADGEICEFRNQRRVLIYLNPLLLRNGENILAFRIIGDPTIMDTGFYTKAPLIIDDYEKLNVKKTRLVQLLLLFVYLVVGLYLLLLFLFRRTELYNLLFALFSIMFFIYLFCRTSTVYSIIPNTKWTLLIEFISLYMLLPLFMSFIDLILYGRIKAFVYGYGIFCASLIGITLFSHYPVRIDILRIWQYTVIIPVIYFIVFQIGRAFLATVRQFHASFIDGEKPGIARSAAVSLVKTIPGNLMIGAMVAAGCAIFDVLDAVYFTTGIIIINYGFLVFIIGITMVLSNRYVYLYREIAGLNVDLGEKTRDLKETRVRYGLSQEKYRLLVEGSTDIIFSMDEKMNFITANKSMCDLLHIKREDIGRHNLLDVLHVPDKRSLAMQFIQEKLEIFLNDKKPLHIRLDFKTPFGIEPVSLQVMFEYINIEGKYEILGRGTSIAEDMLNKYIESEHTRYRIGNLLLVADDLSSRITRNLHKFINKKELYLLKMAIREIIINAIEHGNLAITFDEKSREINADNYFNYINERQKDPRFSGRSVLIDYFVDSDKIAYTIIDEGTGFDYKKYLNNENEANESMLSHGRGISLAKNIFDEIRYNERGNGVTLVKWLNTGQ